MWKTLNRVGKRPHVAVRRLVTGAVLVGALALDALLVGPLPAAAQSQSPVMTDPLFRLYNAAQVDHLYTASPVERDHAVSSQGYSSEGIAAYVSSQAQTGLAPLYRVSRTSGSWDEIYTTSTAERDQAVASQGYNSAGTAAYVSITAQTGLVPLYRVYNAAAGKHLFTTSSAERDSVKSLGYNSEGVAAYVVSPASATPTPTSPAATATPTATVTPPPVTAAPTTTATPAAGAQLLGNPGFETGVATPWTAAPGLINVTGAEKPHRGSWFAWLDGYGTTHTDTLAQTVTVPAATTTATLSFWLHIDTAESSTTTVFDSLTLQILTSSGSATLHTWSNLNANPGYTQQSFDLTAYKGQSITIKFTGSEDASLQTSFVIDDTALMTQ